MTHLQTVKNGETGVPPVWLVAGRGRPALHRLYESVAFVLVHHRKQRLAIQIAPQIFGEQRVMPLP